MYHITSITVRYKNNNNITTFIRLLAGEINKYTYKETLAKKNYRLKLAIVNISHHRASYE